MTGFNHKASGLETNMGIMATHDNVSC